MGGLGTEQVWSWYIAYYIRDHLDHFDRLCWLQNIATIFGLDWLSLTQRIEQVRWEAELQRLAQDKVQTVVKSWQCRLPQWPVCWRLLSYSYRTDLDPHEVAGQPQRQHSPGRRLHRIHWTLHSKFSSEPGARHNAFGNPFTPWRCTLQVSQWVTACHKHTIPVDSAFTLEAVLGQPAEIRKWNIQVCLFSIHETEGVMLHTVCFSHTLLYTRQGLPADALSVENGLIVTLGRRWPLMIDPQTQVSIINAPPFFLVSEFQ